MVHINFTSLLNNVGGVRSAGAWVCGWSESNFGMGCVGPQNIWCRSTKMAGVEVLVWVKLMILLTFIMIQWSFTCDSSLFSIVMNFINVLNLLYFILIHIPLFPWKDIISKNQKIKSIYKILLNYLIKILLDYFIYLVIIGYKQALKFSRIIECKTCLETGLLF